MSYDNPDKDHFRSAPAARARIAGALVAVLDKAQADGYEGLFGHDVSKGMSGPQVGRLDAAVRDVRDRLMKLGATPAPEGDAGSQGGEG